LITVSGLGNDEPVSMVGSPLSAVEVERPVAVEVVAGALVAVEAVAVAAAVLPLAFFFAACFASSLLRHVPWTGKDVAAADFAPKIFLKQGRIKM
jgi:hypothetical protein